MAAFEIGGLEDGTVRLIASHSTLGTSEPVEVSIEGGPVRDVELWIAPGGRIVGEVLGLSFDDLARVEIIAISQADTRFLAGTLDYDGRYEIEGVGVGGWQILASLNNGSRQAHAQAEVENAGDEVVLDLEFGEGVSVSGRVTRSGEPFAGAMVMLEGLGVEGGGMSGTQVDGRFQIHDLPTGRYRLQVMEYRTALEHHEQVEVVEGAFFEVAIEVGRVAGWVVDAESGNAIADASIRLARGDGVSAPFVGFGGDVRSDASGRFELGERAPGSWRLVVMRDGYGATSVPFELLPGASREDLTVELVATEGAVLLVTAGTGSPPASVAVGLLGPAGELLWTEERPVGEGGEVRLDTLPEGTWEMVVGGHGLGSVRASVRSPGGRTPVVLEPAARLEVMVPDLEGEPVVAILSVRDASGREFQSPLTLGARREVNWGRGLVGDLPAGTWTVEATAPDGRAWAGVGTTAAGAQTRVELSPASRVE